MRIARSTHGIFAAALCASAASQAQAQAQAQPAAPVQIDRALAPYASTKDSVLLADGRNFHFVCMGRGTPTVILTAGAGDWGVTWKDVQPAVARTTRACAWDRPGFGLSSPPPSPQTIDMTTNDLQAALKAGGIAVPYVLVGHSLGGYESLLLADREPAKVAGMVLVDPSFPDQMTVLSKVAPGLLAYVNKAPNPFVDELRKCKAEMQAGTLRLGGPDPNLCLHPQWPPNYPPELTSALNGLITTAKPAQIEAAWDDILFFNSRELLGRDSAMVVNPQRNYGSMPLIVLTHTNFQAPPDLPADAKADIPAQEVAWNKGHDEIAALSTRGVNTRVPGTGHYIHRDKPQVVIDAIEEVVREARAGGTNAVAR